MFQDHPDQAARRAQLNALHRALAEQVRTSAVLPPTDQQVNSWTTPVASRAGGCDDESVTIDSISRVSNRASNARG